MKTFNLTLPKLLDYEVRIPPGGKTDALVETTITWALPEKPSARPESTPTRSSPPSSRRKRC